MGGAAQVSRRAVLGMLAGSTAAAGLTLTGCAAGDPTDISRTAAGPDPAPVKISYGSDSSQYGELHLPSGTRRPGTVVVLHGGFWRSEYGAELGAPLAADLARNGWVAWNLEYRRVGNGGGWPATLLDVAAGVDELGTIAAGGQHGALDIAHVVAVGHSAGGQLAAWLAGRRKWKIGDPGAPERAATPCGRGTAGPVPLTGVISQAGVLDLRGAAESGVGGNAVADLLGGTLQQVPGRFRTADPTLQLPIGVPVHCVHSQDDRNVPYRQSAAYVSAAMSAGDPAVLHPVDGDHFTLIDPSSAAWRTVTNLLPGLLAS